MVWSSAGFSTPSSPPRPTAPKPQRDASCGEILGPASEGRERRQTGLLVVSLWVGLVVANFAWLWPILIGVPITSEAWDAQLWLPSWRA